MHKKMNATITKTKAYQTKLTMTPDQFPATSRLDFPVRTATYVKGRVAIYHENQWGGVWDDGWSNNAA